MRGSAGLTPMHVRANMSNATVDGAPFGDVIEFILLEADKLSVESEAAGALLCVQDSAGRTPLHHAIVVKAPYRILQLLIDMSDHELPPYIWARVYFCVLLFMFTCTVSLIFLCNYVYIFLFSFKYIHKHVH